jgi:HAD superfamily phosphatase (TIGR01668 family)
MIYRIIYACVQAWRYRSALASYIHNHDLQVASVVDVKPQKLFEQGIQSLIIDFDGVLASHGEIEPTVIATQWLRECCKVFGPNRIFILSNRPTLERKHYFAKYFVGLNFVVATHKKPFPHSILKIIKTTKLSPEEILVLDDRLLTGILAAIISKVRAYLITEPFVDHQHCHKRESIYAFVRRLESAIFRHY